MFWKKKNAETDKEIKAVDTDDEKKETKEDENAYAKALRDKLDMKYSSLVYWCQALALIICALSIPQSVINKEYVLTVLLSVSAILMIFPMFYVSVVNEYNKKSKEENKNKAE